MSNGRLTVWFSGREALPVRAISYVGGWSRFFPNRAVDYLARKDNSVPRCVSLTAYHRPDGDTLVPVESREWNTVAAKLKAFEAKLHNQYPDNDLGYGAWHNDAVAKLPPGVFVWLDEFELAFQADLEYVSFSGEQPGVDKMTLTPVIDTETRAMVMEGFEQPGAIYSVLSMVPEKTEQPGNQAEEKITPAVAPKKIFAQTWWRKDYDIMLMAQSAGDSLSRKGDRTSNRKIGDAIAKEIEDRERSGNKRQGPDGQTIKNTDLKGWKYVAE